MVKKKGTFFQKLEICRVCTKLIYKCKKSYFVYMLLSAVLSVLKIYWPIYYMKNVINGLLGGDIDNIVSNSLLLVLGSAAFWGCEQLLEQKMEAINIVLVSCFEEELGKKMAGLPYELQESAEMLEKIELALEPINKQNVLPRFVNNLKDIVAELLIILFGGIVIVDLRIEFIFLILVIVSINSFLHQKAQKAQFNFYKVITPINRKFGYYKELSQNYQMGKDVRIYEMSEYIINKIKEYDDESYRGFKKLFTKIGLCQGSIAANIQLQTFAIYLYMIYIMRKQSLSVGDFTLYVGTAIHFANTISKLFNSLIEARQVTEYLETYVELITEKDRKTPNTEKTNNNIDLARRDINLVEFKNVSYCYPGKEQYAIRNLSFTINKKEKVMLIGANGSGKSTIVKLLCRLCVPTEGEILVNGKNINLISDSEYMDLLSVVFQDYKIWDCTVKEYICGKNEYNEGKVIEVLKNIGLHEKILKLSMYMETPLTRNFHNEGIEVSGGEGQKLALGRALYKNAPIVIMDEPTAALDPLAEYDFYEKASSLYDSDILLLISHRMASCKLCDKIIVLEEGKIVETGSHDMLLSLGGIYRKMWETQAGLYNGSSKMESLL